MKKRILSLLMLAVMVFGCMIFPAAAETERVGVSFTADEYYALEKAFTTLPLTCEAWIKFPEQKRSETGVIASNNKDYNNYLAFVVSKNGEPAITYFTPDGDKETLTFKEASIANGQWSHVVLTVDPAAKQAHCYINGQLAQTLPMEFEMKVDLSYTFWMGNDDRSGKSGYFRGVLGSVSLYSDVRTADEIASDVNAQTPDKSELMAHYDFSDGMAKDREDLSGNGYDAKYVNQWIDMEYLDASKFDYSFAVVGDTQKLNIEYPDEYAGIYDWLVDYVYDRKMQVVIGLGDITDDDTTAEWNRAVDNITRLDGEVRYTLVRGNHDSPEKFDEYFPADYYAEYIGGSFEDNNSLRNTWQEITVGDIKYLILCLDYKPSDEALAWAGKVCEEHPEHNVIVTTHSYMYIDGKRNEHGDNIWEKLTSKYENIVLVLSGHEHADSILVQRSEGVNGNVVTEMLIDPQNIDLYNTPVGMVAMFYFSNNGRQLTVRYLSTVNDRHYTADSQFTIEIPVIGAPAEVNLPLIIGIAAAVIVIAAVVVVIVVKGKKKGEAK